MAVSKTTSPKAVFSAPKEKPGKITPSSSTKIAFLIIFPRFSGSVVLINQFPVRYGIKHPACQILSVERCVFAHGEEFCCLYRPGKLWVEYCYIRCAAGFERSEERLNSSHGYISYAV